MPDRPPPQSLEAEQATLGAMMLERDALQRASELVCAEDFYREPHRRLFGIILAMNDRGEPVDLQTLGQRLRDGGDLDAVGGMGYLMSLLEATPTAANVERYCDTVRAMSVRRDLISAAHNIISQAEDTEAEIAAVANDCESKIFAAAERWTRGGEFVPLGGVVGELVRERIDNKDDAEALFGWRSGFPTLDRLLGGFRPGKLIVVGARTSHGKTMLTLNLALGLAQTARVPVAIMSLEMDRRELAMRTLGRLSNINTWRLRQCPLKEGEWDQLVAAGQEASELKVYVCDERVIDTAKLRHLARGIVGRQGVRVLVVDYLQLAMAERRVQTEEQRIAQVAQALASVAGENRICVIATSQVSYIADRRPVGEKPQVSDLRGSGVIGHTADVVAMIYHEIVDGRPTADAELVIEKHRDGPLGTIAMTYHPETQLFAERADQDDDEYPGAAVRDL